MSTTQNSAAEFELSEEQIRLLMRAARSFRDRVILELLYSCGLRRFEACALDVPDIDFSNQWLVIRDGKGSKSRIVPLSDDLANDLRALAGRRLRGPVLVSLRGERLSTRSVSYVVEQAGRIAGLRNPNPRRANVNPHLLRHSFARHFLRRGGRMHVLSQILGHASIATTHAVYGTASTEDVGKEYRRVFSGIRCAGSPPLPESSQSTRVD
ncbi:tyrosine-type recombinase/integrase [Candidatus Bipolaricaulota bacterium]